MSDEEKTTTTEETPEETTTTTEETTETKTEETTASNTEETSEAKEEEGEKKKFGGGRKKFNFASVSKGDQPKSSGKEVESSQEKKVEMSVKDTDSGEENEDELFSARARLYRLDKIAKQWKERGTGTMKLLQHQETKRIRVLMRREKTLKICANHYVSPTYKMTVNPGNEKSMTWIANDFADDELTKDSLTCRFQTAEIAASFMKVFQDSQAVMKSLGGEADDDELEKQLAQLQISSSEASSTTTTTTTTTTEGGESSASEGEAKAEEETKE